MEEEKIAIIGGTGDLGLGLALRWAHAGARVVIGSRDEAKANETAERARSILAAHTQKNSEDFAIRGIENTQAAKEAPVVVLTVPISAHAPTVKAIRGYLKEAIFVDTTVPLAAALGGRSTRMLNLWQGSAAAQARELIPAATPVLAAFHSISGNLLQDLSVKPDCDILICGDDEAAKKRFSPLVNLIPGLRSIDAGPLEMSRIVESMTALLISVNRRYRVRHSGIRITGLEHHTGAQGR